MNGAEILAKAEREVQLIKSTPFAERLAKSIGPTGPEHQSVLVRLSFSEMQALEIGKEMVKAFGQLSRADGGIPDEEDDEDDEAEPRDPNDPEDDDEEDDDDDAK